MKYLEKSFSVGGYKLNPDKCCEACVFGSGEHEAWCNNNLDEINEILEQASIEYGNVFAFEEIN